MTSIAASDFVIRQKQQPGFIIDVRTPSEFRTCHLPGSTNIPLELIERGQVEAIPRNQPIFVLCQSGLRSERARKLLEKQGFPDLTCIEGGIADCEKIPGAVTRTSNVLPIMRQVQLAAGFLVTTGITLAHFVHPAFLFLSLFVGLGLMYAGATGFCGMAILLEKMPWNQIK